MNSSTSRSELADIARDGINKNFQSMAARLYLRSAKFFGADSEGAAKHLAAFKSHLRTTAEPVAPPPSLEDAL
jgi:hypothetical protein